MQFGQVPVSHRNPAEESAASFEKSSASSKGGVGKRKTFSFFFFIYIYKEEKFKGRDCAFVYVGSVVCHAGLI